MRKLTALVMALALIAVACTSGNSGETTSPSNGTSSNGGSSSDPSTAGPGAGPAGLFASALESFDSCDAFLSYVRDEALEFVGPYGLNGGSGFGFPGIFMEETAEFAADAAASDDSSAIATTTAEAEPAGGDGNFSGTNVQEIGVDEPDIVKTDGDRILAVAQGSLIYFDVTPDGPVQRGQVFLDWGWNQEMFIDGDTVVVMATMGRWDLPEAAWRSNFHPDLGGELSTMVQIDISNPDELVVGRRVYVDGRYVSARMVDGVARVVTTTQPVGLDFVFPSSERQGALDRATEVNRQAVLDSTIENWVPAYMVQSPNGDIVEEGSLVDCENAYHPSVFSGFGMLSVVTFALDGGVHTDSAVGVLAGADTVYASADSLYVASQRWVPWQSLDEDAASEEVANFHTNIHRFDITDPSTTSYEASGSVAGFMLNQFSMSEHDGHLRVAATTRPAWWWFDDSQEQSESFVSVLRQDGTELVEVGSVAGLGLGEQIFAVRFLGDVGYVVTFRQIDPLYTIDLSDPENPRATGELKIPGFSSYLHPIGENLLMGVGQDATDEGQIRGLAVSVFDVSDMENPIRTHKWTLENDENSYSNSEAEYDHRAFLYWPETGTTVLPVSQWSWDPETGTESGFFGAVVLEVSADGIEEVGRISQERDFSEVGNEDEYYEEYYFDWGAQVRRSMVIGDAIYTLSEVGLMASDLASLATIGAVYFDGLYPEEFGIPVEPGDEPRTEPADDDSEDATTDTSLAETTDSTTP